MVYYTKIRLIVREGEATFILPSSQERVRSAVFLKCHLIINCSLSHILKNSLHLLFIFL